MRDTLTTHSDLDVLNNSNFNAECFGRSGSLCLTICLLYWSNFGTHCSCGPKLSFIGIDVFQIIKRGSKLIKLV